MWSVSSVSVSASGWSVCRMVTVCFLCRGRCGTVAPAEALVPASPSHNHPLYTVLYCTVQCTHIAYHYVPSLLQSMGGTKKIAWDMLKMSSLPRPPLSSWPVSGDGAGGRGDIDIEVTMCHHFIILRILNFNTQRCRISDVPIKIDRYQLTTVDVYVLSKIFPTNHIFPLPRI